MWFEVKCKISRIHTDAKCPIYTFIKMISISDIKIDMHTRDAQPNARVTSRKIKWHFAARWQPLIAYSRRDVALTYLLSLMFDWMHDALSLSLSLDLMRIDSAGTSVTFITLDSTACGYGMLSHSWSDTCAMPYLTQSHAHEYGVAPVKRLHVVVWSTVFSTLYVLASMHYARMAWTCDA